MSDFSDNTISGLIGALAGSVVAYFLTRQAQKVSFAFDFHREFNTIEMVKHRGIADKLITKWPDLDFTQLGETNDVESDSLFLIMRFYQRMWLSIKYHQVKEILICEMFSNNFYYWYYVSFKENFVHLDWSGSSQMVDLANWFYENVKLEEHMRLKTKYEKQLAERRNKPGPT